MSKSMNYATDTHALVWYFTDDLRLSKKALEAFEQPSQGSTSTFFYSR